MYSKLISAVLTAVVVALPAGAQSTRHTTSTRARSKASARLWTPPGAWKSVYTDGTVKVAIDSTQTKRQSDGTYLVRLRWQYPTSQMIGTRHAYRTMVDRKLIDCTTQGIKPVSAETYDVAGKPVSAYESTDAQVKELDWAKRPAGSSAAKAYAAVCGRIRR